jgi:hypothetical protein
MVGRPDLSDHRLFESWQSLIGWKRVDIEEHWFQGWSPNNT